MTGESTKETGRRAGRGDGQGCLLRLTPRAGQPPTGMAVQSCVHPHPPPQRVSAVKRDGRAAMRLTRVTPPPAEWPTGRGPSHGPRRPRQRGQGARGGAPRLAVWRLWTGCLARPRTSPGGGTCLHSCAGCASFRWRIGVTEQRAPIIVSPFYWLPEDVPCYPSNSVLPTRNLRPVKFSLRRTDSRAVHSEERSSRCVPNHQEFSVFHVEIELDTELRSIAWAAHCLSEDWFLPCRPDRVVLFALAHRSWPPPLPLFLFLLGPPWRLRP